MVKRYHIRNLSCSGCAAQIEAALANLPGVMYASINLADKRLRMEGEEAAICDITAFNRIAGSIEPDVTFVAIENNAAIEPDKKPVISEQMQLGISAVLFAIGLIFEETFMATLGFLPTQLMFFGIPYLLCGTPVLLKGLKCLMNKDFFNEFTLMGVATIAAIFLGELPEAVGVMLFYRIGEAVQERAAGRSRRSITALLAARPSVAHVLEGLAVKDVDPSLVSIGTRILVKPGEKIPLDGTVISGTSQVDTSPLTGEPVPVAANPGAKVFAGTLNIAGALTIQTTAHFEDSSVSRILELVERAAAAKAPTERFITRFARVYTPIVVALAVLIAVVPPLAGLGAFQEWAYRALVLLVISCPCALVISIPLGYFGGIGAASRRGILIKGGQVLDALRAVNTVAMDKTGTLTHGVFEVTQLYPSYGVTEEELLQTAALAESRSTHPIARSILKACPNAPTPSSAFTVEEISGKGLLAQEGETRILAGNAALLEDFHILCPSITRPGSVVYLARNTTYLGAIVVSDRIRPEAADVLAKLREEGIARIAMLTGDRPEAAQAIATELDMDTCLAGLLPEDKATALLELGPPEHTLFVGDGINDAPVLATAGVGVAMGGLGSEAAIEVADAVILEDSLARLPELLRIARKTRTIVWQNIVLALAVKSLFMCLGVVGLSGLWEAVFADVGVALLAVLNATRTAR